MFMKLYVKFLFNFLCFSLFLSFISFLFYFNCFVYTREHFLVALNTFVVNVKPSIAATTIIGSMRKEICLIRYFLEKVNKEFLYKHTRM